jgi:hypothetical protein
LTDGYIEATRELTIFLPPDEQTGHRRAELLFAWSDGRTEKLVIPWEIRARIQVSPPAVLVRSDECDKSQRVSVSAALPFRITEVSGSVLQRPPILPSEASRHHELDLLFDPTQSEFPRPSEVVLITDDAKQPKVSIKVLIPPAKMHHTAGG